MGPDWEGFLDAYEDEIAASREEPLFEDLDTQDYYQLFDEQGSKAPVKKQSEPPAREGSQASARQQNTYFVEQQSTAPASHQQGARMRYYLDTRYEDRVEVKKLGARYDPNKKRWYYQRESDAPKFAKWKLLETVSEDSLAENKPDVILREAEQEPANQYFAKYKLAKCYQYGDNGFERDREKAVLWYTKAGEAGYAIAWIQLGNMYRRDVPPNMTEAIRCYENGARLSNAECMNLLGNVYREGNGVAADYVKARKWFEGAERRGNMWAKYSLSFMYENGRGVEPDHEMAKKKLEEILQSDAPEDLKSRARSRLQSM